MGFQRPPAFGGFQGGALEGLRHLFPRDAVVSSGPPPRLPGPDAALRRRRALVPRRAGGGRGPRGGLRPHPPRRPRPRRRAAGPLRTGMVPAARRGGGLHDGARSPAGAHPGDRLRALVPLHGPGHRRRRPLHGLRLRRPPPARAAGRPAAAPRGAPLRARRRRRKRRASGRATSSSSTPATPWRRAARSTGCCSTCCRGCRRARWCMSTTCSCRTATPRPGRAGATTSRRPWGHCWAGAGGRSSSPAATSRPARRCWPGPRSTPCRWRPAPPK